MKNKSKIKGYLFEAKIREILEKAGFKVFRMGQPNQPDLVIEGIGRAECKCKKGLKGIYDALGKNDLLFLKWQSSEVKKKSILVVMELERFLKCGLKEKLKKERIEDISNQLPNPIPCSNAKR
jgi:hypothetical protein